MRNHPPLRELLAASLSLILVLSPTIVYSTEPDADEAAANELPLDDADREHWSYLPLAISPVPDVRNPVWSRSPIDRFILRRLDDEEIEPQPPADRRTLIRRVSFDLLGIPPSSEDVQRFVSDQRPDAYERLVDRYLASPRYGEHVAQVWLDLAKFAETDGFEHDQIRPRAWQFRDWVIASFNSDVSYDEFLSLQIAGDLLYPENDAAKNATAFGLSGPDMPDINSQDERRHIVLNQLTSTLGEVVLGMQIGCAKCHDHKYDAISQADFYRLRAIFDTAIQVKRNKSLETLAESAAPPRTTRLWEKGDWRRPGPTVVPAFPRVVNVDRALPQDLADHPRVALAKWLTTSASPITSRVIVNRVWQTHFGRGFSDSPSDFGVVGDGPSHPELLDWLAQDLQTDWSLKRLHRNIVLSSVYRQVSRQLEGTPVTKWQTALKADSDGKLLSRFPRRRIRAEMVRDAMLVAADATVWNQSGPGVRPPLPDELKITLLRKQWDVTEDVGEHHRRSIYVFARRNLRYPVFEAFDRPEANASCGKRAVSTTAPQALFMLNSKFAWKLAEQLAVRAEKRAKTPDEQIRQLFEFTLSRQPTDEEIADSLGFLAKTDDDGVNPLTELALVLFNCNEFYYID
jgi:hypothetical protein